MQLATIANDMATRAQDAQKASETLEIARQQSQNSAETHKQTLRNNDHEFNRSSMKILQKTLLEMPADAMEFGKEAQQKLGQAS
ncbi:hypothetical protein FJU08_15280 [Martelella alba]|uniref:Uncharacterized protein n=1 Tax=Martelella alba TaxID=2590451 RepID=A0A506U5T2_9HYPH|nr:hypothetical protein [Martelella alba]TPW29210.1 hypothetical protein FJU08_15280 [Martelella alba]